jgi:hypothetical protein
MPVGRKATLPTAACLRAPQDEVLPQASLSSDCVASPAGCERSGREPALVRPPRASCVVLNWGYAETLASPRWGASMNRAVPSLRPSTHMEPLAWE